MIRFDPSLLVRRMVVHRGAAVAYDESFHAGVNIVRGENSSGKSTILNLIHYGLGGDVTQWSEVALLCDRVTLEVELSGKTISLSRGISQDGNQPMDVAFGGFQSLNNRDAIWQHFPYRRSQNKESFSQVIFRQLGIPEAANEDSGNITVHQMMRLLYADQMSPVDAMFAHESFDSARTREAVGKLLCGAFDDDLYAAGLAIRNYEKRLDLVTSELNGLYKTLGVTGHSLNSAWVVEQNARVEQERREVAASIAALKATPIPKDDRPTLKPMDEAYENVKRLQLLLGTLVTERESILLEEADSTAFIASLEAKRSALADSMLVAGALEPPQFSACPACYAEVPRCDEDVCALCKEPFDAGLAAERLGGIINETALQIRQSKLLQEHRRERLYSLDQRIDLARAEWSRAASKYSELQSIPVGTKEIELSELYRKLGYLDRRVEDIQEKAKIIQVIENLTAQKTEISGELARLRGVKDALEVTQDGRLKDAYLSISDQVRSILARDLKRQDSFDNPQVIDFSFESNKVGVDGHTYFSASSRAILKSAFILGLHAAACAKPYFRHPRFVMLDTIEDKGMEAARSHNFQSICVSVSEASVSRHQIIFGTAMIAPLLDTPAYTVGRFYTRQNPSLIV